MFNNILPKLLAQFPDKPWKWADLMKNPNFDSRLIENYLKSPNRYHDYIAHISANRNLTSELIEKYADDLTWSKISRTFELSCDFIKKYENRIVWEELIINPSFTRSGFPTLIYQKYAKKFQSLKTQKIWNRVSKYAHLTCEFIDLFYSKLDMVSLNQNETIDLTLFSYFLKKKYPLEKITTSFPNSPQTLFDWEIQKKGEIDLAVCREFQDEIDWELASYLYRLPLNVIAEYQKFLDWDILLRNSARLTDLLELYPEKINWENVFTNQHSASEFIEKYQDKADSISPRKSIALIHTHSKLNPLLQLYKKSKKPLYVSPLKAQIQALARCKSTADWVEEFSALKEKSNVEDEIKSILDSFHWLPISENPKLTLQAIEGYEDYFNWKAISWNSALTLEIIQKYHEKINWRILSQNKFNLSKKIWGKNRQIYAHQIHDEINQFFYERFHRQYETVLDMLRLRIRDFHLGLRSSMV